MPFIPREESFVCEHCKIAIKPLRGGTYRNHCSHCLHSKHVDETGPGDRASSCQGLMKPIGIDQDSKKGFVLIHECVKCAKVSRNKSAVDDELTNFQLPDGHNA